MQFGGIELFLDDERIAWTRNIRREIQPARRHEANPVISREYPWEASYATIYGSVLYDDERDVFRMWYNAYGEVYFNQQMLAYAESKDGVHWEKPLMEHSSWPGHERTNIVMGPDPNLHGPGIIRNPDPDNGAERYLLMFDSYPRWRENAAALGIHGRWCYTATSADGLRWSPQKGRPAFAGKADSCQSVVWDERTKTFKAYVRGVIERDPFGQRIRYCRLVESPDFVNWGEPIELWRPDEEDGYPDVQVQQLAVTMYEGISIGLLSLFRIARRVPIYEDGGAGGEPARKQAMERELAGLPDNEQSRAISGYNEGLQINDIQLVTSRDGVHFSRVADRQCFMRKNEPENWIAMGGTTSSHITMASQMLLHDDAVWIYFAKGDGRPDGGKHIGLATIPRDRFVAMLPERLVDDAVIELVPMRYPDGTLQLNACTSPVGVIRAEIADFDGAVVEGFERENAVPVTGDSLDHPVTWQRAGETYTLNRLPPELRDRPVRLRFWLHQARIFALRAAASN